ncbi:penicillin-binding protein 2 [Bacteroidia bacterium]|nr:penicillin-binding protein 2 [Bacteroidia bacterium]
MNNHRAGYIYLALLLIGVIYILRLLQIQVLDDKYAVIAEKISLRRQTVYPQRGLIFDREKNLVVYNEPVYDLMLSLPIRLKGIDTGSFCEILEIDRREFDKRLAKAKKRSYRGKSVFKKNVSNILYARVQERLYEFKGFFFEIRQDRNYKYNSAAHVLGYLGEINRNQLKKQEEGYYEQGDYNGKKGVERFYEDYLRGVKGEKYFYVDKFGVNKGSYKEGKLDVEPIDGNNLFLSIDIDLQQYGELLLNNKMGSVVAIEPQTGEVLALISSPFYNPANFNIQNRGKFYSKAINDPTKPIFNRAVSAPYPPGSTFKPVMALIGLEDGAISENTHFGCPGYYKLGRRIIKCHEHTYSTSLQRSIASSCNTYYCNTFKSMMQLDKYANTEEAYNSWRNYLQSFGLGAKLGVDVSGEFKGWLMDPSFYDKMHGKDRWSYANIISLSFGQGELGLTPLQMANVASSIANRGYYFPPHVVKQIEGIESIPQKYLIKKHIKVSPSNFSPVIEGMFEVTKTGTGSGVAIKGIDIAGKTGTVQNPHGKNHSAYMAFAPVNDPKIAIAVVVEESGYGATWAAPIAHLMIEHYLQPDSVEVSSREYLETKMKNSNLIPVKYRELQDASLYGK